MTCIDTPSVKILTGVHRHGRSAVLKMIMERLKTERNIPAERMVSCRYDSMEFEDMTAEQMCAQLKKCFCLSEKTYLFLDGIQEIRRWRKVVDSLASDFDIDLYITDSNFRVMSSKIFTYLIGRYMPLRIFMLSFNECLMFRGEFTTVRESKAKFTNYIRLDGFPITYSQEFSQDEVYTIVRDIYSLTTSSDTIKRNRVRKVDQLERVVKYIFSNVGNTFPTRSVADYLKTERCALDNEMIYSCLEELERAYLLHRYSGCDLQGEEILRIQEEFHLADTAPRYSVLGHNMDSVASSPENTVYLELCRWGYAVNVGKTSGGETDFVTVRQNREIYVQVTQKISSGKAEKRECERLLEVHGNYPKYALTTDEFAGGSYEGIRAAHIADFLLSFEY